MKEIISITYQFSDGSTQKFLSTTSQPVNVYPEDKMPSPGVEEVDPVQVLPASDVTPA